MKPIKNLSGKDLELFNSSLSFLLRLLQELEEKGIICRMQHFYIKGQHTVMFLSPLNDKITKEDLGKKFIDKIFEENLISKLQYDEIKLQYDEIKLRYEDLLKSA